MDKDTTRNLTEADNIFLMTETDGWKLVKSKLDARILDLQNINNLDTTDLATLPAQLAGRKFASEIIYSWLKDDIYGFIEQQQTNTAKMQEQVDNFVERL